MHSQSHVAVQQVLHCKELKNFAVWRNSREEGSVGTNKQKEAHMSSAVAGHRQPLHGSSAGNNQESQRSQK